MITNVCVEVLGLDIDLSEAQCGNLLLHQAPCERWVCDPNTLQVEVAVGVLVEVVRDVGYVYMSISVS